MQMNKVRGQKAGKVIRAAAYFADRAALPTPISTVSEPVLAAAVLFVLPKYRISQANPTH